MGGSFSSWSLQGAECWSDPALELSVFVGSQVCPLWAHPEMRQEVAGIIYGSLVSTPASKYIVGDQTDAGGGWQGQLMNTMMMMSMFGGGGMMTGMQPGAAAQSPAAEGGAGAA